MRIELEAHRARSANELEAKNMDIINSCPAREAALREAMGRETAARQAAAREAIARESTAREDVMMMALRL
jgi:hypothetical protein